MLVTSHRMRISTKLLSSSLLFSFTVISMHSNESILDFALLEF